MLRIATDLSEFESRFRSINLSRGSKAIVANPVTMDRTILEQSRGHGCMHAQMEAWKGHARTLTGRNHGRLRCQICLLWL